jgi:hypothetical protein
MVNAMALLSISAAARASGKDRNTIKRYLKDGRLSSAKDANGNMVIDSAELVRVFGALKSGGSTSAPVASGAESSESTSIHHVTFETLREQLKAAQEREEWLKKQLEAEQERYRSLEQRMLPPVQGKKGFFARIFG